MQAVLVMFRSSGERRSFSVTREITVLGRREDCDLMIPLAEVSRKHCRLVRDGDLLKIEDLGSANGTFLNGQRVQESLLAPGDTLQVGPVVFVLQIDGVPADDELQPVHAEGAMMAAGAAGGEDADVHPGHPEDGLDDLDALGSEPLALPEFDDEPEAVARPAAEPETDDEFDAVEELEPAGELDSAGELEPVDELEPAGELEPLEGEEGEPTAELEPLEESETAPPASGGGHDAPIPMDDLEPAPMAEGRHAPIPMDDLEPTPAAGADNGSIPMDDLEPASGEPEAELEELEELAPEGAHDDGLGDLDLLDIDAEHEQKH